MSGDLANHLWQSTAFALAVGLLTLAFRRHQARVRYALWFAASAKFLIPFTFLIGLGSQFASAPAVKTMVSPAVAVPIVQFSEPFTDRASAVAAPSPSAPAESVDRVRIAMLSLWACGFLVIAAIRVRMWRRIRAAVRHSVPWTAPGVGHSGLEVRVAPGLMEPGVVGLWRPLVLLPFALERHLTPRQLEAVLAHERCHVERRDNLTAASHMVVEAACWFHPLVWWIGARLLHERERACDEQVLKELGEPRAYAEGILNICKRYVEAPLACVSGVGGGQLRTRIEAIMANRIGLRLDVRRRVMLAVAAMATVAAPLLVGAMHASQQVVTPSSAAFNTVSIKRSTRVYATGPRVIDLGEMPFADASMGPFNGRFRFVGAPLSALIELAYNVKGFQVRGGPPWVTEDGYDVDAVANVGATLEQMRPMIQSLLADRFKLTLTRTTTDQPIYELIVAPGGARISPLGKDGCIAINPAERAATWTPQTPFCGMTRQILSPPPNRRDRVELTGMFMPLMLEVLSRLVGRVVIDKTGFTDRFIARLEFAYPLTASNASGPSIFAAVEEQLGLQLVPATGPVDVLEIESVERPAP
jgi:bla regulator protein blaR1